MKEKSAAKWQHCKGGGSKISQKAEHLEEDIGTWTFKCTKYCSENQYNMSSFLKLEIKKLWEDHGMPAFVKKLNFFKKSF